MFRLNIPSKSVPNELAPPYDIHQCKEHKKYYRTVFSWKESYVWFLRKMAPRLRSSRFVDYVYVIIYPSVMFRPNFPSKSVPNKLVPPYAINQ